MGSGHHVAANAVGSRNIRFVGHSDQGGRSDGVQVMVHRGYAYVGHTFSNGITIVDVRDPAHPRTVEFIACPPNTRAVHLQTHDDLLLAVNGPSVWHMQEFQNLQDYFEASPADKLRDRAGSFASGIRVFDISRPEKPAEIGSCRWRASGPTASGTPAAATPTRPFTSRTSPTTSSRSSTWPTRSGPRSPGGGGSRVCGTAARRRRPGARAVATHSTMPSSRALSPTARGGTVA
jgi:LVIVD repeat